MLERGMCSLCSVPFDHYGNNPDPIGFHDNRVCDECNEAFVIPARLGRLSTAQMFTLRRIVDGARTP